VLPVELEFIVPQDGHEKQECENAAAKRWLDQFAAFMIRDLELEAPDTS